MRKLLIAVLAALATSACGNDPTTTAEPRADTDSQSSISEPPAASPASNPATTVPERWLQRPPPIVLSSADRRLRVRAHTFCLTAIGHGTCADGIPPDPLPDLGKTDAFVVSFPSAIALDVVALPAHAGCGELFLADTAKASGAWSVRPRGPAGRYDVQLRVHVPSGELDAAFAMTTTTDGHWPEPEGTLLGFTGGYEPGDPIGWTSPSKVSMRHLGGDLIPGSGELRMSGAEHEISLPLAGVAHECDRSIEFPWAAPKGTPEEVLGNPPYDIEISVEIDGALHTAHAEWPRDQTPYDETPLTFEPPLPSR